MKKSIFAIAAISALLLTGCNSQKKSASSPKSSVKISKVTKKSKASHSSKNVEQSSSSSQQSSSESSSSSKPKEVNSNTKMNFNQIAQGNYSSLIGNWQLVKAVGMHKDMTKTAQDSLNITSTSISTSDMSLTASGLKASQSKRTHPLDVQRKADNMVITLADADKVAINWGIYFYPAGSQSFTVDGEKQDAPAKNTIVVWTSNNNYSLVFEEEAAKTNN